MSATSRILIIDDELAVRELMCEVVESEGLQVIAFENADAGLAYLEQNLGVIDLVITDVTMPGQIDGYELAKTVRERWPEIPVIVTSGYYAEKRECFPADLKFLAKPWLVSQLIETVKSCLNACKS